MKTLRSSPLLALALIVGGCEGPMGPEGPQGPAGDTGPAGPPAPDGAQVATFSGPESFPESDSVTIALDEYGSIDDPPLVVLYKSPGTINGEAIRWRPSHSWDLNYHGEEYDKVKLDFYVGYRTLYYVFVVY